jgi:hypothetical protein
VLGNAFANGAQSLGGLGLLSLASGGGGRGAAGGGGREERDEAVEMIREDSRESESAVDLEGSVSGNGSAMEQD